MDEFEDICRCCSTTANKRMHNMFERKIGDEFLCYIYYKLSSIKVQAIDGLPQNVCNPCYTKLRNFYKFRIHCIETEDKLNSSKSLAEAAASKVKGTFSEKEELETSDEANENLAAKIEDGDVDFKLDDDDVLDEMSDIDEDDDDDDDHNNNDEQGASNTNIHNEIPIEVNNEGLDRNATPLKNDRTSRKKRNKSSPGTNTEKSNEPKKKICSCKQLFDTLDQLKEHCRETGHKKGRIRKTYVHVCKICNKKVTQLRAHMLSHTGEKKFECEICGKRFSMKFNMKSHLLCHSGERPYACDICGSSYRQSYQLKEHKRVHSGEEPYVCKHCGKKFPSSSRYKYHLLKHPEEDQQGEVRKLKKALKSKIQCNICNKELANKYYLKTHMLFHGKKNYLCSDCGNSFATKDGLNSHIRVHTGEKPYSCSFCGRSFNHRKSHRAHELIHKGLKPYVCEICSKAFTQKTQLKIHIRTHSGEKPYGCTLCGKLFSHSGSLKTHLKSHSPI